jgi:hypothetical protein
MGLKGSHYVVVGCLAAGAVVAAVPPVWFDGGYAEIIGWGTTKGLKACRDAVEMRSMQSGVPDSTRHVYIAKCFERHERPVNVGYRGDTEFTGGEYGMPIVYYVRVVNASQDTVITGYEIVIKEKATSAVIQTHVEVYRWLVPGDRDALSYPGKKAFKRGEYEWSIGKFKGVKIAY